MKKTTSERIDAVILAGGINRIELFPGYVPGYKALIPFAGRPSILYPLEALRSVARIGRICVVGPKEEIRPVLPPGWECDFVPEGKTVAGSLIHGMSHFSESPSVLVATADLPLATAEAVGYFLNACSSMTPEYPDPIYLSIVPQEEFTGPFEGFAKGFARFRGGAVSHGNLVLLTPRLLHQRRITEGLDSLYRVRKNGLRTSLALGWRIALGYLIGAHLLRRLTLEQMGRLVSRQFKIGLVPVPMPYPGIALDVDEPADYALVKRLLEGEGGTAGHSSPERPDHSARGWIPLPGKE